MVDTLQSVPKTGRAAVGEGRPLRRWGGASQGSRPTACLCSAGDFDLEQVKQSTYFFS